MDAFWQLFFYLSLENSCLQDAASSLSFFFFGLLSKGTIFFSLLKELWSKKFRSVVGGNWKLLLGKCNSCALVVRDKCWKLVQAFFLFAWCQRFLSMPSEALCLPSLFPLPILLRNPYWRDRSTSPELYNWKSNFLSFDYFFCFSFERVLAERTGSWCFVLV